MRSSGTRPGAALLAKITLPDAAPGPAPAAVVDGLGGTVLGRHVPPASAGLEDMHDARDHPPIIDPGLAGWFSGRCSYKAAHASSESQNRSRIASLRARKLNTRERMTNLEIT